MKRIAKIRKGGFTLVETMCAVVIMIITSTMLINGFIASMGYSYHTSVYTRSAGNNYATCINRVANLHGMAEEARHKQAEVDTRTGGGSVAATMTFSGGVASLKELKISVSHTTANSSGSPLAISGVASEDDLYLDNRHSFFYYPTVNNRIVAGGTADDTYLGRTHIYKKAADGAYYWCYVDDTTGKVVEIQKVS